MLFSILRDSREEEGRGFLTDRVRNSKAVPSGNNSLRGPQQFRGGRPEVSQRRLPGGGETGRKRGRGPSCKEGEVKAFWAEGTLGTHGTYLGLEGPRLPGVMGLEGGRAVRINWLRVA